MGVCLSTPQKDDKKTSGKSKDSKKNTKAQVTTEDTDDSSPQKPDLDADEDNPSPRKKTNSGRRGSTFQTGDSVPGQQGNGNGEEIDKRKVEVKKQRRRLSVAPQHVGDIQSAAAAAAASGKERRFSMVSADHIPTKDEPKKFVAISKKGYVPYNKNKVNQDTYFCDYQFAGNSDVRLFGVCDGHGEFGHNVSGLIARKLPKYLQKENFIDNPREAMTNAVLKVSETLKKSSINTTFSGSTLVFSLLIKNKIYTGNLGDSRGICAFKRDNDLTVSATPLSFDHKPENTEEHQRIVESGGRVAPLPGPPGEDPGPNRVWLADIDVPGLAMSRSLGDDVAHSVGVSSIPEITEHDLTNDDQFLMYGSDGIWEFIPNDEAAQIVDESLPDLRKAALALVKHAITRWRENEEVIDDITAVIFNLKDSGTEEEQNAPETVEETPQIEQSSQDDSGWVYKKPGLNESQQTQAVEMES